MWVDTVVEVLLVLQRPKLAQVLVLVPALLAFKVRREPVEEEEDGGQHEVVEEVGEEEQAQTEPNHAEDILFWALARR